MAVLLTHRVEGATSGATVLLLNGGMMSISAWDEAAAALAPKYRVVRCDFRGQFLTPELPPPELAAHVDDVTALLDHLGLARVHVVGTSFGGEVGLLLAARHPERVASLVAAAVVDYPPPRADAVAQVAVQQPAHVAQVLLGHRLVQPIRLPERGDLIGARVVAQGRKHRVCRNHVRDSEGDERDAHQHQGNA